MKRILTIGIILLFIGMSISSSTGFNATEQSIKSLDGKTLYVGGSGPGNYTKIQDAIDNASDGDTVFVYNGTYVENLIVNKSINLIGEDRNTTVIDGNNSGDVVFVSADWVNISGFTLQNSGSSSWPTYDCGIELRSDHNTITNNVFSDNDNGIYLYSNNNNLISRNKISSVPVDTIGIMLDFSYYNIISNNNVENNTYGIMAFSSNFLTFKGNNIVENKENGILLIDAWFTIVTKNNFQGNNIHAYFISAKCWVLGEFWISAALKALTNSFTLRFNRNFWERNRVLPFSIPGEIIVYGFFAWMPTYEFQWRKFDWFPSQEPYNLGV